MIAGIPLSDKEWLIIEDGYDPERIPLYETLFTLANGYVGTRGSLESGSQTGSPGTFFASVFDAAEVFVSELASAPNWLGLRVVAEGERVDPQRGGVLEYRRTLDIRRGILAHLLRWRDPRGRVTRYESCRLVHMKRKRRHLALIWGVVVPENYSGSISVRSSLDGYTFNAGRAEQVKTKHFRLIEREDRGEAGVYLEMETYTSAICVGEASKLNLRAPCQRSVEYDLDGITETARFEAEEGKAYSFEKLVSFYTSRETNDVKGVASGELDAALAWGSEALLNEHICAWEERWKEADVKIDGDEVAGRSLRFSIFHLIQCSNAGDERTSIGARGLHGEGYRGHVFWDTELFMLPFYIYTDPPAARSLLMYRYHNLDAARENARLNGYRGAQFPWESADTGREVTPKELGDPFTGKTVRIWTGEEEHHITADVAFGVDHYCTATGDEEFLLKHGAEILLETARFWASRAEFDEGKGRYVIKKVIGPDEFHEHVDNSVYTNAMARWNLHRALEYADRLGRDHPALWSRLTERIGLRDAELASWQEVADGLYISYCEESGLYEEFEGYFDLEDRMISEFDGDGMPVVSEELERRVGETTLIKQADVVMLHYLLGDQFGSETKRKNFEYYEARTTHRSSLGPSIYAIMGAEVGDLGGAYRNFIRTARTDLDDNQRNTHLGIHAAAMGGTWQAAVNGFAGMRIRKGRLSFRPQLPAKWKRVAFKVKWQGNTLGVVVTGRNVELTLEATDQTASLEVLICGNPVCLQSGRTYTISI